MVDLAGTKGRIDKEIAGLDQEWNWHGRGGRALAGDDQMGQIFGGECEELLDFALDRRGVEGGIRVSGRFVSASLRSFGDEARRNRKTQAGDDHRDRLDKQNAMTEEIHKHRDRL